MAKYFCPQCVELSLRSNVYPGEISISRSVPFFDEDGDYQPEVSTRICQYTCSIGHTWSDTANKEQ